ncbi:MAG: response regulator transcription factor [Lachnospiraceae bacterium]
MKHIIIVEDEVFMREELEEIFQKAGYLVTCITEFSQVVEEILQLTSGLVLLDLNLPGKSGFQICQELKQKCTFPILILTSRDQMKDELQALHLGADEYLTKPCRSERLLARVSNLFRRYEGRSNLLEGLGYLLDKQTYTLYIRDQSVILPQNQGKLLEAFLINRNEIITKETLCNVLWGTTEYIDENALQVNLTRLKKNMKVLGIPQKIEPVRGKGYRMEEINIL